MRLSVAVAAAVVVVFAVLCGAVVAQDQSNGEWAYRGTAGPSNWGGVCNSGFSQSPIDVLNAKAQRPPESVQLKPLSVDYKAGRIQIVNNGRFISAVVESGSRLTDAEGFVYNLERIDFHTPAEHTLRGLRFPLEIQLIHRSADKTKTAAVAVLVKQGVRSLALGTFLDNIPKVPNTSRQMHLDFNALDLLPKVYTYYTYTGSLTSPPCTEPVLWYVMDHYYHADEDQLTALRAFFPTGNARPVQPLHSRVPEEFRRENNGLVNAAIVTK